MFATFFEKKMKKYFGGLENGCIFASAFEEKRLVEKVVEKRRREKFETDEKIEIACVGSHTYRGMGRTRRRVKKGKRTILTMKSLILAQDER